MKKRAPKRKPTVAKAKSTRKSAPKAKKPAAKATKAKATPVAIAKPTPYTPAPLKGDGWPPFRYPLV